MDLTSIMISSGVGVYLETQLENVLMSKLPNWAKPFTVYLFAQATGILQAYVQGQDWKQAIGNAISTFVVAELKHQSPLGSVSVPSGQTKSGNLTPAGTIAQ